MGYIQWKREEIPVSYLTAVDLCLYYITEASETIEPQQETLLNITNTM